VLSSSTILIELYGEEKGKKRDAEAFELCEYGRQTSSNKLKQLVTSTEKGEKHGAYYLRSVAPNFTNERLIAAAVPRPFFSGTDI
jgi:hypothetical protein